MAIVLALSAAFVYGSADFVGGLASRRAAALSVALGAQVAGLLLLLGVMPFLGPATVAPRDILFGAVAGLFGGLGVVVVFSTLAKGPMSVVAPTTALAAAVVPILAGVVQGERPGPTTVLGMLVSLVAVVLITRERSGPGVARAGLRVLLPALGGGAIFGLFFVFLHQTGDGAGLWPLLGARLVSVPVLALLVSHRRVALGWSAPGVARAVLVSGVLDMAANVLYLLALRHGMLAVVAALTGLYPASTVVLAQARLDERMEKVQVLGLGVAACAAVLVAL